MILIGDLSLRIIGRNSLNQHLWQISNAVEIFNFTPSPYLLVNALSDIQTTKMDTQAQSYHTIEEIFPVL